MPVPNTIRAAAIQMCSTDDREKNLEKAAELIERAARDGASLVALPENFSYLDLEGEKIAFVESLESGPSITLLRSLSARHGILLIGGSVPLKASEARKVTNSCLVFDVRGEIVCRYDKIHLFDISLDEAHTFRESRHIQPGNQTVTFEALGTRMGLSICYDLRFPELYRTLTNAGARILFVPAAFTMHTGKDHWEVLLRARAIENQCYVIAPAQYGHHNPKRISYGHTMIIDPWGHVLARAPDRDAVVVADLDLDHLDEVRRRLPCLGHQRIHTTGRTES